MDRSGQNNGGGSARDSRVPSGGMSSRVDARLSEMVNQTYQFWKTNHPTSTGVFGEIHTVNLSRWGHPLLIDLLSRLHGFPPLQRFIVPVSRRPFYLPFSENLLKSASSPSPLFNSASKVRYFKGRNRACVRVPLRTSKIVFVAFDMTCRRSHDEHGPWGATRFTENVFVLKLGKQNMTPSRAVASLVD